MYHGDFALESTFDIKFTTRQFTTGAPFALASGTISAYVDNDVTQLTAGITLSADFDGVTGLNNVRVVATNANGYAAGGNYTLVITVGTVDSVSVVGECVGSFSIQARSALRPTVATRTLDVSAGGEAGLDWANIGSPTTAQNLSGTNIDVDQIVASVSGAVGSVTGAVGSVTGAVGSVTGAVGSVTGNVGGNVTGSVGSVATGGIAAGSFAAGAIDAAALAADAGAELADAFLNRDMATGTDSGSTTVRTVRQALRFLRNKWSTSAIDATTATLTVTKEDDSTASWTAVVTSDSNAHPIIANDPAGP